MRAVTAKSRFDEMHNKRSGMIKRCERYAELTIPSACTTDGYSSERDELTPPLSSVGSQAANNLINKMVLAMFAPSRPFMRLSLPAEKEKDMAAGLGIEIAQLQEELSGIEKEAIKHLDGTGSRPKLYDLFLHLIVTGNCLRLTEGDNMRVIGIKNFVSRRNIRGEVIEIILREKTVKDELPDEVQPFVKRDGEQEVGYYRWWKWDSKRELYIETQWVDEVEIQVEHFRGQYKREDMPALHHTWRLPDGNNYGIGHVEDCIGDFEGLDQLTEAEINGALLASEFRWIINPSGMTRPEDFKTSANGAAIPGNAGDVELVQATGVAGTVQSIHAIADVYIRRIGTSFLMANSGIRNAERVTAEEIRVLAQELETGLGGVYSRLAIDLQLPIARWLVGSVKGGVFKKTDFEPTIVTGLDALSRNGDLENLQMFLQDVVGIAAVPPEVSAFLKLDSIFSALAAGRGLRGRDYVNSQQQVQEAQQQQALAQQQMDQQNMAAEAAAKQQ